MRRVPVLTLLVSAALVAGSSFAVHSGKIPLGVPGEWEWLRHSYAPAAADVFLAGASVAGYAVFAGLGMDALKVRPSRRREAFAVLLLSAASVAVQAAAQTGAPAGYGLAKWVLALHPEGASGYLTVAKNEAHDLRAFLYLYPDWVRGQDALHIGTHPPGLVACEAALLHTMEGSPAAARFVLRRVPESVAQMLRIYAIENPMTAAERATMAVTGFLTLLACGATVVPLYLLARATLPAPAAWSAAALWPVVPAAVLFQPLADTGFPLLSTTALALAAHAGGRSTSRRSLGLGFAAGVVLGLGMQLTIAFLAVGLVVAVVIAADRQTPVRVRLATILATGLGFAALTAAVWVATRANPVVIWWWNQRNHVRFYAEYPRTYRVWIVVNPVELFLALGIPVSAWACLGLATTPPREIPRVVVATAALLAFLTLGGRNLSEVGRLWLPFMPALLVGAGAAMGRSGAGPRSFAATVLLVGTQTLLLQAMIQVVCPVTP